MPASDLEFPNFAALLIQAIDEMHTEGMIPFSHVEQVVLGHITALEDRDTSIGDRIVYEIDFLNLPKWVALVGWLSPFGLCSHHPKMVLRIANYLLGHTRSQEEAGLPSKMRAKFGV